MRRKGGGAVASLIARVDDWLRGRKRRIDSESVEQKQRQRSAEERQFLLDEQKRLEEEQRREEERCLWEYAMLYERYDGSRSSSARLAVVFDTTVVTTAAYSTVSGFGFASSGRPWNDVPTPKTTRILPPEVPGAD